MIQRSKSLTSKETVSATDLELNEALREFKTEIRPNRDLAEKLARKLSMKMEILDDPQLKDFWVNLKGSPLERVCKFGAVYPGVLRRMVQVSPKNQFKFLEKLIKAANLPFIVETFSSELEKVGRGIDELFKTCERSVRRP